MIRFIEPEEKYIESYWATFDAIAKEGKYLAADHAFPMQSTVEFVRMVMEKGIPQLFVIDTHKDICVGWCDALPREDASVGYVGTGLAKEYRDRGYGTLMIKRIITLSAAFGYRRLELDVRASNARAARVYEKCGFVPYNRLAKGGFTSGDNVVPEEVIQMRLTL